MIGVSKMIEVKSYQITDQIVKLTVSFDYDSVTYQKEIGLGLDQVEGATEAQLINKIVNKVDNARQKIAVDKTALNNLLTGLVGHNIEVGP